MNLLGVETDPTPLTSINRAPQSFRTAVPGFESILGTLLWWDSSASRIAPAPSHNVVSISSPQHSQMRDTDSESNLRSTRKVTSTSRAYKSQDLRRRTI